MMLLLSIFWPISIFLLLSLDRSLWQEKAASQLMGKQFLRLYPEPFVPSILTMFSRFPLLAPGRIWHRKFDTPKRRALLLASGSSLTFPELLTLQKLIVLTGVLYALLYLFTKPFSGAALLMILLITSAAAFLPDLWLKVLRERKVKKLHDSTAQLIDMLILTLDTGMNIEQALLTIAPKMRGALGTLLMSEARMLQLGSSLEQVMTRMKERVPLEEFQNFITSLLQAKKLGVSLNQTLRIQSALIRTRRVQRAEELGRTATVKITFPLVFFIFPALLLIFVGPALIQLLKYL